MCLIVSPTLSIMAIFRFCSACIQSSRVLLLALALVISVVNIFAASSLYSGGTKCVTITICPWSVVLIFNTAVFWMFNYQSTKLIS
jgi:hypothetical protein